MACRRFLSALSAADSPILRTPRLPRGPSRRPKGRQPACGTPAFVGPPVVYAPVVPCAAPVYPLQPAYRVEQGPIHNVVVVPYEEPHPRFIYLPPRFMADCACYR